MCDEREELKEEELQEVALLREQVKLLQSQNKEREELQEAVELLRAQVNLLKNKEKNNDNKAHILERLSMHENKLRCVRMVLKNITDSGIIRYNISTSQMSVMECIYALHLMMMLTKSGYIVASSFFKLMDGSYDNFSFEDKKLVEDDEYLKEHYDDIENQSMDTLSMLENSFNTFSSIFENMERLLSSKLYDELHAQYGENPKDIAKQILDTLRSELNLTI